MELKFHKIIKAARDHFSMIFLLSVTDSISLDAIALHGRNATHATKLRNYNVNTTKTFFVDIEEAWLSTLDRQGRVTRPFVIPGAYEPEGDPAASTTIVLLHDHTECQR